MSLIAEFSIVSPLMREAEAVPEMVFHTEDIHMTQAGEAKHVFWTSGDDFDTFESALQANPTTKEYACLTELDDRRLYRVTYPEDAVQELLYPKAAEYDMVYLDITTTHEESHFRARIPTLEALKAYREACQEEGIPFQLHRLYQEQPDDPAERFELTPAQYEVLVQAHERGYFNQPRCVTLEELAEEVEVTSSALGRRLRRALNTLVEQTVRSDTDGITDQSPSERDAT
ncbi:helix-turn-helix domain-containing protein (plasmid) [Natrinema zhouii]|uniref:helix-turn-helix domain-containing protein n=1 Tax=Natrinema zhouii TaxID=1710539 RepID=UPI001CFF6B52|nr:helix-turn-helix domain-containing protein [Natrinema zhouii]UHQ98272.1 helix-turn-helix domain-containing protein [Natrinema zhouii]